jgi:uncharacterized protein YlxW (UPF0749 family)
VPAADAVPSSADDEPTLVAGPSQAPGRRPTSGSTLADDEPTARLSAAETDDHPAPAAPAAPEQLMAPPVAEPPTAPLEPPTRARATADHPAPATAGDDPAAPVGPDRAPGSPDPGTAAADPDPVPDRPAQPPWKRLSSAGALIWLLLALFGFTLAVQLRSNDTDDGLASARQEDLVRILSDLEARDTRLQGEIAALETSQRQLTSGVAGRQAALAEAEKRAEELGLLAGTLPGRGPGLEIRIRGVKASAILNAVQELRGAGGEVMALSGASGGTVRIVASTYFVDDGAGGVVADGTRLAGPYTLWVIGPAPTMRTALEIPGGVVASVKSGGGSVTMEQRAAVEVTAVREASSLQYARPVS